MSSTFWKEEMKGWPYDNFPGRKFKKMSILIMKGYRIVYENFVRVKNEYNKSRLYYRFNLICIIIWSKMSRYPCFLLLLLLLLCYYYYYYNYSFLWEKIKPIGRSYRFNSNGVPLIFEYSLVTTVASHLYVNLW